MYLRLFVCLYLCTHFFIFIRIFNRICICICIWRQVCTWQDEFRLYPLAADWGVRSAPGAESVLPVWLFHGYISHTMPVIIAVIICIVIISVISVIIIVTLLPSIIIVVINIQVFVFRLIVQFDCVAWLVIIISSRVRWPLAYMISSSWFLIAIIIITGISPDVVQQDWRSFVLDFVCVCAFNSICIWIHAYLYFYSCIFVFEFIFVFPPHQRRPRCCELDWRRSRAGLDLRSYLIKDQMLSAPDAFDCICIFIFICIWIYISICIFA